MMNKKSIFGPIYRGESGGIRIGEKLCRTGDEVFGCLNYMKGDTCTDYCTNIWSSTHCPPSIANGLKTIFK
jgi:hypothetical protein